MPRRVSLLSRSEACLIMIWTFAHPGLDGMAEHAHTHSQKSLREYLWGSAIPVEVSPRVKFVTLCRSLRCGSHERLTPVGQHRFESLIGHV
jgi:hypothetical protein